MSIFKSYKSIFGCFIEIICINIKVLNFFDLKGIEVYDLPLSVPLKETTVFGGGGLLKIFC